MLIQVDVVEQNVLVEVISVRDVVEQEVLTLVEVEQEIVQVV